MYSVIGFMIAMAVGMTGRLLNRNAGSPLVIILLGVILMASSSVTFIRRIQNQSFARKTPAGFPGSRYPSALNQDFRRRAQELWERSYCSTIQK